jgi:hypothetical protein
MTTAGIFYVCYIERGYEGCTPPLAVFDTKEKAQIFKAGSDASYGSTVTIKPMNLNQVYND